MKFSEMVDVFNAYVDDSDVDEAVLAEWFNEAQKDLALDFAPATTYVYEQAEAGRGYPLPADCIEFLDCDSDYEWSFTGSLVFSHGGSPVIAYKRMPPPESLFDGTDPNVESYLPPIIHDLMVIWACYRYWLKESEGDTEEMNAAMRWYQDYHTAKANMKLRFTHNQGGKADRWKVI